MVGVTHLLLGFLFLNSFNPPATAESWDLNAAFQEALRRNENVPIAVTSRERNRERVNQFEGVIYPTLSAHGHYQRQDDSSAVTAFSRADQYSARLTLNQPLFSGLREFAELGAATRTFEASEKGVEQAKLATYAATASAYYGVLAAEKDLSDLKVVIELSSKRADELKTRVRIGRSRKGEMLAAQAQLATLNAQVESAENQLRQNRYELSLVTGLAEDATLSEVSVPLPKSVPPVEEFLKQIEQRPEIQSQVLLEQAAHRRIDSAWGAHLPSLDFQGNYYLKRSGILENTKWDVNLLFTVPIFQGGIVQSQVREFTEQHKQETLRLAQLRRTAEREIRSHHENLQSNISQTIAFKEAASIAEDNFKEQTRDYTYGLVTNLEVLQALNTLQDTKRLLDRAYYQAKTSEALLQSAIGKLP